MKLTQEQRDGFVAHVKSNPNFFESPSLKFRANVWRKAGRARVYIDGIKHDRVVCTSYIDLKTGEVTHYDKAQADDVEDASAAIIHQFSKPNPTPQSFPASRALVVSPPCALVVAGHFRPVKPKQLTWEDLIPVGAPKLAPSDVEALKPYRIIRQRAGVHFPLYETLRLRHEVSRQSEHEARFWDIFGDDDDQQEEKHPLVEAAERFNDFVLSFVAQQEKQSFDLQKREALMRFRAVQTTAEDIRFLYANNIIEDVWRQGERAEEEDEYPLSVRIVQEEDIYETL